MTLVKWRKRFLAKRFKLHFSLSVLVFLFGIHQYLKDPLLRLKSSSLCNIPVMDSLSISANFLIEIQGKLEGSPKCIGAEVKFEMNHSTSAIIKKNPHDAFWSSVNCCYTNFRFDPNRKFINGPECYPVVENITKIPVEHEYLDINCKDENSNEIVYRDQFHKVRPNKTIEEKISQVLTETKEQLNPDQPSIIVLGIDTMSHANFIRYLPKTQQYLLNELQAIEFHGHNKIGPKTLENLIAFLTGCKVLLKTTTPWRIFKKCELIYEKFNRLGYRTFHFEDTVNNLNYYRKARRSTSKTGTWYNNVDFMEGIRIIENHEKNQLEEDFGCFDNQFALDIFVDNILDVARTYLSKLYFTFLWSGGPAHHLMRNAQFMDLPLVRLLTELKTQKLINNTIIFVISDHGPWHGEYLRTKSGRLEQMNPILYVYFPEWFKTKYSVAVNTMELNSKLLTTPFDLYETFKDLLNISQISNEVLNGLESKYVHPSYEDKFGQSLFHPIPNDRTCKSANIPLEYCMCFESSDILNPSENENVVNAAKFTMDMLQATIQDFPQCAQMELMDIVQAKTLSSRIQDEGRHMIELTFNTYPVGAEFTSTVSFNPELKLIGKPIRTNIFGQQSKCIAGWDNATYVKTICYCV